jgi:hypothetical protein
MTKFFKIIAVLFCFTITIIVFKDGLPEYSYSKGYAGYMAALVLFIAGVGILINLLVGKSKPITSYKEYLKKVKATTHTDELRTIEQNIQLLEQSFNDGLLNRTEFQAKMESLKEAKSTLRKKRESEKEFDHKKQQLLKLYDSQIVTKNEFDEKIKALRNELKMVNHDSEDLSISDNTKVYYVSDCKQYGPLPISYVVYLLKTRQINPNCFYKLQNEETYSHRVRELMHKLAS